MAAIPSEIISLCTLYCDTSECSLRFIIEKFKQRVPEQQMSRLFVHTTCALQEQDVRNVFEDTAYLMLTSYGAPVRYGCTRDWQAMRDSKINGRHEMWTWFSSVAVSVTVLFVLLLLLPYNVMSYLELAVS